MAKQKCSCKPEEPCYHALADVFFIPTKPLPKRKRECVVCGGGYPNCRCFEGEDK